MTKASPAQIVLPEQLVSSVDLSRTLRELQAVDESLRQAELRKPGTATKLARSSTTLEELASLNKVSLTNKTQRTQLIELLKAFQLHAPRIHMSLAVEPSANFTRKVAIWLRANIHPLAMLEIGLQPTLAAGCMIRTSNKIFDMSLRHSFAENRHLLVEKINEIGEKVEKEHPAPAPAPAAQLAAPAPAVKAPAATQPPAPKEAAK